MQKSVSVLFTIVIIVLSFSTLNFVFARSYNESSTSTTPPLSITTNFSEYAQEDDVKVTGHVSDVQNGSSVTLQVFNPANISIAYVTLLPSLDGNFNTTFFPAGGFHSRTGFYTIAAQYGKYIQKNSTFYYIARDPYNHLGRIMNSYEPPLQQIESGRSPENVQCKNGNVLVRSNSGMAACVIPQTAVKLFQRGWGWTYINGNMYSTQYNIKNISFPDMISVVQNRTSSLDAVVEQGGTVQIPWEFELGHNFSLFNVQLSIYSPSDKIKLWLNPVFPYTTINGEKSGNKTITIYADPNTQPGNYTAIITDVGDIKNQINYQYISLNNSTIGVLHLIVKQHMPQISIDVGDPHYHDQKICNNQVPTGEFCVGFTSYQDFTLMVYSQNRTTVDLSVHNNPFGGWIKFVPQKLTVGPSGAKAKLLMSGIDVAYGGNPLAEKALVIQATSKEAIGKAVMSVREGNNLAIIHSPNSFQLGSTILNSNQTGMVLPGVVYDPSDNSNSTLQVNLSPLGMVNGGKITPFPSWFSVKLPQPSITLYSDQPYYFRIETITSNAPLSGNYTFAIGEEINGTHFIGNATFLVENRYMG